MLILGINTALATAEIALFHNGKIISTKKDMRPFSQAISITGLIEDCVKETSFEFSDIDIIGCAIGPGSFTGIRIGIAAAKGLEIALEKPLIGVDIFESAAFNYKNESISVLVDSRRGDFFMQEFDENGNKINSPSICDEEAISDITTKVVFTDKEENLADNICFLALDKYNSNINSPAVPLYIRPADVTVCKK